MCFMGLAKDRKRVLKETVAARVQRTGDGSYKSGWVTLASNSDNAVWNQDKT